MTDITRVPEFRLVEGWPSIPAGIDHRDVAGIAVDAQDNVYIAARTRPKNAVYRYSPAGEYQGSWGEEFLVNAHGLTIVDDLAYLTDLATHSVYVCTLDGEIRLRLGDGLASDTGYDPSAQGPLLLTIARAAGPFNRPTRAMPTSTGEILVADGYGNARVHRFDPDGQLIGSWGEPGSGPGQFNLVHGLWVDSDDRVFVTDRENHRVQIFSTEGVLLDVWEGITRPADICIDAKGTVFVGELFMRRGRVSLTGEVDPDDRQSRVSIRNLTGREIGSLGGGADRLAPSNFASAHDLCVDSTGALYVGEVTAAVLSPKNSGGPDLYRPGLKTVQKFERL